MIYVHPKQQNNYTYTTHTHIKPNYITNINSDHYMYQQAAIHQADTAGEGDKMRVQRRSYDIFKKKLFYE